MVRAGSLPRPPSGRGASPLDRPSHDPTRPAAQQRRQSDRLRPAVAAATVGARGWRPRPRRPRPRPPRPRNAPRSPSSRAALSPSCPRRARGPSTAWPAAAGATRCSARARGRRSRCLQRLRRHGKHAATRPDLPAVGYRMASNAPSRSGTCWRGGVQAWRLRRTGPLDRRGFRGMTRADTSATADSCARQERTTPATRAGSAVSCSTSSGRWPGSASRTTTWQAGTRRFHGRHQRYAQCAHRWGRYTR